MTRTKKSGILFTTVFIAMLFSGCIHRGPRSDYRAFYQNHLAGIRVPTYEEIISVQDGSGRDLLDQPSQRVWEACLDLAAQSKGILGMADDERGGHRLLIISGQDLEYRVDRWSFVDRWLAISIRPAAENSTEALVAFVSPKTAQVAPFNTDRASRGFKSDILYSVSAAAGGKFLESLREYFKEYVYIGHLSDTPSHSMRGTPRPLTVEGREGSESIKQENGNFRSARIRREQFVLNFPRLTRRIEEIVQDLARAANQQSRETRVFAVVGPLTSTHIEPNGDIFVTTGLLNKIQSTDELAGVLAHELAHIYLGHQLRRARGLKLAGTSKYTLLFLGALGGAVAGGLIPTSTKPHSASPQDTLLTPRDILVGTAVGLGGVYLGDEIGLGLGVGIGAFTVQRFSRKQELEADAYGAELLWAAGYDYHRFLSFLQSNVGLLEAPKKKEP